jgi:hypothetical protein
MQQIIHSKPHTFADTNGVQITSRNQTLDGADRDAQKRSRLLRCEQADRLGTLAVIRHRLKFQCRWEGFLRMPIALHQRVQLRQQQHVAPAGVQSREEALWDFQQFAVQ